MITITTDYQFNYPLDTLRKPSKIGDYLTVNQSFEVAFSPLHIAIFLGDRNFYIKSGKLTEQTSTPSVGTLMRFLLDNPRYLLEPMHLLPTLHPCQAYIDRDALGIDLTKEMLATLYGVKAQTITNWLKAKEQLPQRNNNRYPNGVLRLGELLYITTSKNGDTALRYWRALAAAEADQRGNLSALKEQGW